MPRLGKWTPWRVLGLLLVIALSLAILAIPQEQIKALQDYGYAGIFLISLLANVTIIIPAPAILIVFAMGAHLSPLWLGLAAGSGAALGELSGYVAGLSGQAVIEDNATYQRLAAWVRNYGGFTIFALAALPNPFFDLGGIAAGALRMPVPRFLAWCGLGKILRMTAVALAGAGILK
ncbi:MAG: VTT domain-containing protein [Anaerolineales bacterium]